MNDKKLSFEQSINRLEEIVKTLERGDAPLSQTPIPCPMKPSRQW